MEIHRTRGMLPQARANLPSDPPQLLLVLLPQLILPIRERKEKIFPFSLPEGRLRRDLSLHLRRLLPPGLRGAARERHATPRSV